MATDYDLKITGGTIFDGTGAPGVPGDVGIRDGRIAALGEAPGSARETLDAQGRAVAPGFVDIHTHYDAQILWDRMLTISPWHGVTSVAMGNCGFGVAPTRAAHRDLILRTLEKVEGMSLEALRAGLGDDWGFESFPQFNTNEDEVAECLTDPNTVLGLSDAGAHASQLCDACFSTHVLGHWVREKGVLSLEQARSPRQARSAKKRGVSASRKG